MTHRWREVTLLCDITFSMNKKEAALVKKVEAAKELGISVRSLQRIAADKKLSVTQKRGKSGKSESFFNADEIKKYKESRDLEKVRPALVTTGDTVLARNDANQFLEILKMVMKPETKPETKSEAVPIADKPLLKLHEAARLTGLSRDILRKAIETKDLKGKMIGRAYRIKRDDLDRFIKNL
jgi:excisionase family DNA binding protein